MKQTSDARKMIVNEAQNWASDLETVAGLIGPRFPRSEPRARVAAYLRGLISPIERKNSWQLAEQAGNAKPYGVQHLLGGAR